MSDRDEYDKFRLRNREAHDTWATVSFEDWNRCLRFSNSQTYWGDFVKQRDAAWSKDTNSFPLRPIMVFRELRPNGAQPFENHPGV